MKKGIGPKFGTNPFSPCEALDISIQCVIDTLDSRADFDHVLDIVCFESDHFEDLLACGQAEVKGLSVKPVWVIGLDHLSYRLVELFIAHNASIGHGQTSWNRRPILLFLPEGFITAQRTL